MPFCTKVSFNRAKVNQKLPLYCKPTSKYKIKTMYVYYIAIEIYVFVYTNIFSSFYFFVLLLCHAIFLPWISHNHKLCQNLCRFKFQFLSQFYFIKFCTHTTTCSLQVKVFPKVTNIHFYINQKKLNKKNLKIYTSHDSHVIQHAH